MTWDFGRFAVAGVVCLDQLRPLVRLMARACRVDPWYQPPGVVRLAACGVIFACLAGVWFSGGDLAGALVGAVMLFLVLLTDTAATTVRNPSEELDPWMTGLVGHARELPVIIGLAIGGDAAGVDHVWLLAAFAYGAAGVRESVVGARWLAGQTAPVATVAVPRARTEPMVVRFDPSRPPEPEPHDPTLTTELLRRPARPRPRHTRLVRWCGAAAQSVGRMLAAAARRGSRLRSVGQGDRFAVIAVTAVFGNATVTFVALSALAVLAMAVELATPTTPDAGARGETNDS